MNSQFVVLAIFLACTSNVALGESWIPVGQKTDGIEIDQDSIGPAAGNTNFINVTWRLTLSEAGFTESTSSLNCDDFSFVNLSRQHAYTDGKRMGLAREQYRWSRKVDLFSQSASKAETDERNYFPTWNDWHGQILKQVCPRFQPNWEERWLSPPQSLDCRLVKSLFSKHLCDGNREVLRSYNLIIYRMAQDETRCSNTRDDSVTVLSHIFGKADLCRDEMCINNAMVSVLTGLEKDLKSTVRGQGCNFVADQLAVMNTERQQAKQTAGAANYLRCAKFAASLLDDRLSSAETVAIALHSKCKPLLDEAFGQSGDLELSNIVVMQLRPKLIEFVLDNRAMPPKKQGPPNSGNRKGPKSTI